MIEESVFLCSGHEFKNSCRRYTDTEVQTVPASTYTHFLTRVAHLGGGIFSVGDYDREHNHAELYDPPRIGFLLETFDVNVRSFEV